MLPFQVGAIERNRTGVGDVTSSTRAVRVSRIYVPWLLSILFLSILFTPLFAKPTGGKKKQKGEAATLTPTPSPGEQSLTNIPLATGHEAKGLILPDFDSEGRLRGKFEAGTAHRIDEDHIGFRDLKITTYTPEQQRDLEVDLRTSILNLKTRILTSQERTIVRRADFNIEGDSVRFDTVARTGRLVGNVKMIITDKSHLLGKEEKQ
jgi:hypothetical protein